MVNVWKPDLVSSFIRRRLGIAATEPGSGRARDEVASRPTTECPGIWELDNGDIAVIGKDITEHFREKLPEGVGIGADERMVVLPPGLLISAKPDIPDELER